MIGTKIEDLATGYSNFRTLLDAGHDIRGTLGLLRQSASGEARSQASKLLATIEQGRKLSDGMKALKYPEIDIALVSVGEETGFLPEVGQMLATYYDERVQMLKAIKGALPQPLVLLTISLVTSPLPALVSGKMSGFQFLLSTFGVLGLVLGTIYFGFATYRRMLFDKVLRRKILDRCEKIKGVRSFVRTLAMERFLNCAALSLKAGCDFFETARLLDIVSEGTYLRKVPTLLKTYAPNEGWAKAMARAGVFTDEQIGAVTIGEATGSVAKQFEGLAERARQNVHSQIKLFAVWVPKILYGIMVAYVAYTIVKSAMSSPLVTAEVPD